MNSPAPRDALIGAGLRQDFEAAGATHVLDTVAGLLPMLAV
jgi:hypothetical protein